MAEPNVASGSGTGAAPATVAAPAAIAADSFDWAAQGLDADTSAYVATKGFKTPVDVITSYRNYEKLQGVPADQMIKLPKHDADPKEWRTNVWEKLGAGKTAEEYKLPVPEGGDPEFAKTAAGWFHETGIPVKTAAALTEKWNNHIAEIVKQGDEAGNAKLAQETEALKKEWGANHDSRMAMAKNAAGALGVKAEAVDALAKQVGFSEVMKMFATIAEKTGEANFTVGDGKNNFGGTTTPAQAQARIRELKSDPGFRDRYLAGDAGARAEMEKLHKIGYPDDTLAR